MVEFVALLLHDTHGHDTDMNNPKDTQPMLLAREVAIKRAREEAKELNRRAMEKNPYLSPPLAAAADTEHKALMPGVSRRD